MKRLVVFVTLLMFALGVFGQEEKMPEAESDIKIPLHVYQKLLHDSQQSRNEELSQVSEKSHTISQASYKGKLKKHTIFWTAEYQVDVFSDDTVDIPLLPSTLVVSRLDLDKKTGTVFEADNKLVTKITGKGRHKIVVDFQISINQRQGLPEMLLTIPRAPINNIELRLPGKKEIRIATKPSIKYRYSKYNTFAKFNISMSEQLHLKWSERLPDTVQHKFRANAKVFHTLSAQKGLMKAKAIVELDIKQGTTKVISLVMPIDVQIDQVSARFGGVLDWVMTKSNNDKQKILRIYLDRAIKEDFTLDIEYEKLLDQSVTDGRPFLVPFLRVLRMQNHKGMVSIISGSDLLLKPVSAYNLYEVSQNELPADIQDGIYQPVLYTYKYNAKYPKLHVQTEEPEFVQGIYNVQMDSLFLLDSEKLLGKAIITLDIKSGYIWDFSIDGSQNINLLSVTGPGVDSFTNDSNTISLKFKQAMRGQLRLVVEYENSLKQGYNKLPIPILNVNSANISSGNIAIVSLLAADLTALNTKTLTEVHVQDLPQQLLVQTSNPIALAYKYANTSNEHNIELRISRHKELKLQDAVIENAQYQTLITNDGLVVTKARFTVQNNYRQFLRVKLPESSKIWSVFIDGNKKNVNNVSMEQSNDPDTILINLSKSQASLFVDMVYATPSEKLDMYGAINMNLPVPDLLVNQTNWDLYLPVGLEYYGIDTNMNILAQQRYSNPRSNTLSAKQTESNTIINAFDSESELTMPSQGIHYAFDRLYANQMQEPTRFSIYYASEFGYKMAERISVIAVIFVWVGLLALRFSKPPLNQSTAYTILVIGIVSLAFTLTFLHADSLIPTIVAIVGSLAYVYFLIVQQRRAALL